MNASRIYLHANEIGIDAEGRPGLYNLDGTLRGSTALDNLILSMGATRQDASNLEQKRALSEAIPAFRDVREIIIRIMLTDRMPNQHVTRNGTEIRIGIPALLRHLLNHAREHSSEDAKRINDAFMNAEQRYEEWRSTMLAAQGAPVSHHKH